MKIAGLGEVRTFPLKTGTKQPANAHGHLEAKFDRTESGNYGIALDGQFLVIDIDKPDLVPDSVNRLLVGNSYWVQTTPKGTHYLFKVPEGFTGHNIKLKTPTGEIYGDLKVNGYIVGPGSVVDGRQYQYLGNEATECPEWALKAATRAVNDEQSVITRNLAQVPYGSHDSYLTEVAGLAYRQGFTDEAIIAKLMGELQYLAGYDPTDPYTEEIFARRLASWKKAWSPPTGVQVDAPSLDPTGWKSGLDISTDLPLTDWWIHNFIPRSELVLIYGDGGIGKSTFASYLAAQVLRKGGKFGVCSVEEPFVRFVVRTMLSLAPSEYPLLGNLLDIGNLWKTPDDMPKLREALGVRHLDLIYFDAIKSHSILTGGSGDASVLARAALSPLAALAQEMGITVLGTLHTNKLGAMSGSTEWANVPRVVLEAKRKKDKHLRLRVHKTNFMEPDYQLVFPSVVIPGQSLQGVKWEQKDEDGSVIDVPLVVITEHYKSTGEEDDKVESPDFRMPAIELLKSQGKSIREIAEELGISKSTIHNILKRVGKTDSIPLEQVEIL